MSSIFDNSEKPAPDWGEPPALSPEQIILWLEGHRALMFEIWKENPTLRLEWERINQKNEP